MQISMLGYTLSFTKDAYKKEVTVAMIKKRYQANEICKITAIKLVRNEYLATTSPYGTLKGAKDLVDTW